MNLKQFYLTHALILSLSLSYFPFSLPQESTLWYPLYLILTVNHACNTTPKSYSHDWGTKKPYFLGGGNGTKNISKH